MVKDIKVEEIKQLVELKNKLWQSLNTLRGSISTTDYHFVLYLLILHRKGILKNIDFSNEDTLKNQIELSVQRYEGSDCTDLKTLDYEYRHIFENIENNKIFWISHLFDSLDQSILVDHFPEVFDDLLYRLLKSQGRQSGEALLPNEISRFVCSLDEIKTLDEILERKNKIGDKWPYRMAYNPFAGIASFSFFLQQGIIYEGQEINKTVFLIGRLRFMAYEKSALVFYDNENSIENWKEFNFMCLEEDAKAEEPGGKCKFDLIISCPPFGMKLPNPVSGKFGNIRNYEHFLIEKGIESLRNDGQLIAVLSQGFLTRSGSEHGLRQHLVENDLLEMVIALPGGLLTNTGIPIVIIVINKNKKDKGLVRFIDAKHFVDNTSSKRKVLNDTGLIKIVKSNKESDSVKIVTNAIISNFNFNLNTQRYFEPKIELKDNEKLMKLGDLLSVFRGQRIIEGQIGKFVRIMNLKDTKLDFQLDFNRLEKIELPRHVLKITESCLLLAARWNTLKPTYFTYSSEPIFITPDIVALNVDKTKSDISYLINELHAQYVLDQVESFRIESVIPSIRKEDLLNIKIRVPASSGEQSLIEQKAKVKGVLEALAEEKKIELDAFNKIHGLENEILEQNAYLRHSLAGASTNLIGSIDSIKKIIEEQIVPLVPGVLNFKVSPLHVLNFNRLLEILEENVSKIYQTTSRVVNTINPTKGMELYPVEIYDFLDNFVREKNAIGNLNYKLIFQADKESFMDENASIVSTFILANKDLLTTLLDNILQNAEQHAFPGFPNNRIEIYLMIYSDNNVNKAITILISNTGRPFPEDFTFADFVRNGSTTGENSGNGYGGWLINQIVKYFKGELAIIDEQGPEGLPETDLATSFEISIPITQFEADENV